jgi:hypothetical protein
LLGVLHAIHDVGHVVEKDGRIVAVGDHYILVIGAGDQLIVGVDLVILPWSVKVAFGLVDAGSREGGSYRFQVDAVGLQLSGIHLDAHGRLLATADADQADPVELGDFGRQAGVDQVLYLREGHGFGGDAKGQHGRVRRVGLAVDRRRGQVGGQEALRGVNRRLDFFLRDVNVEREIELQHHHRGSPGAGGGHLAQALHFAKLPFQRGGHGGGNHVRAGSGIEREYLDGRVVNLRQGGDRQLGVGDDPYQHDGGHQQ